MTFVHTTVSLIAHAEMLLAFMPHAENITFFHGEKENKCISNCLFATMALKPRVVLKGVSAQACESMYFPEVWE